MSDITYADAPWHPLRNYLSCVHQVVNTWRDFLMTKEFDWVSDSDVLTWLKSLDVTLQVLGDDLIYNDHQSLEVQTSRSGLPCHTHIGDMARVREQILSQPENQQEQASLRHAQLDHIFETGSYSLALLRELSAVTSKKRLSKSDPLRLFHWRGIKKLSASNGASAYLCAWECYTAQPLPVRYVMMFEADDDWRPTGADVQVLQKTLDHETRGMPKLGLLGSDIDRAYARIHPKWISRIVLGPLFISHLTKDDNKLQHTLDAFAAPGENLVASRIIYEYVLSEGEKPMRRLVDSQRRPHRKLQNFGVRLDGEHHERQVTHLEKHLFAPHRVIQLLDEDYRKEIGHQLNGVST